MAHHGSFATMLFHMFTKRNTKKGKCKETAFEREVNLVPEVEREEVQLRKMASRGKH